MAMNCKKCGAMFVLVAGTFICNCLPVPNVCPPRVAQVEYCDLTPARLNLDDEPAGRTWYPGPYAPTASQGASGVSVPIFNGATNGHPTNTVATNGTFRIMPYPKSPDLPKLPEPIVIRINKARDG